MDTNISDHITYREATFSSNAVRLNIDNTPNQKQLNNITAWALKVFEPWRSLANCPISVDVIFRSGVIQKTITGEFTSVNKVAGGDSLSQHQCEGGDSAGDLDNDNHPDRLQNNTLFIIAYNNLIVDFDKIIAENIDESGHVSWNHVSYNTERNQRRQSMVSFFVNNERVYRKFEIQKGFIRSKYLFETET